MMDVEYLNEVLVLLVSSPAIGTVISIVVGLLKSMNVVKDGTSKIWLQLITLAVFVTLTVLKIFGVDFDMASINSWLEAVVTLAMAVISMFGSNISYGQFRGTPLVGTSYSERKRKIELAAKTD